MALGYAFYRANAKIGDTSYPEHQLQLRSVLQLAHHVEVDSSAYYVARIAGAVPAYLRLDLQLSWRPAKQWELSATGQNLLKGRHNEFGGVNQETDDLSRPAQRTVNGKVTWRF